MRKVVEDKVEVLLISLPVKAHQISEDGSSIFVDGEFFLYLVGSGLRPVKSNLSVNDVAEEMMGSNAKIVQFFVLHDVTRGSHVLLEAVLVDGLGGQ